MKIFPCTICLFLLLSMICKPAFAQKTNVLKVADSLFTIQNWKAAKEKYTNYLGDTSVNSLAWNRLGYCNYNLALYTDATTDYNKALANNPPPPVRNVVLARMARVYSIMNKTDEATDWLIKATITGYNSLPDLDSIPDFKNLRMSPKFKEIRQQVYEIAYPCTKEPRAHDFDFWIGDWSVYPTGSQFLVGHSQVESMAGGCAILENWTSTQAENGKSFNYYDQQTGKWEQDWIGSGGFASGRQRYYNGEYKNGAMHFTYETTNAKGEKQAGNFIFYNIDKDTVRQYQDISNDGGKTFTVSYDFTYIGKKA
jgi:tetratricopeptide (TPR) repeat protein